MNRWTVMALITGSPALTALPGGAWAGAVRPDLPPGLTPNASGKYLFADPGRKIFYVVGRNYLRSYGAPKYLLPEPGKTARQMRRVGYTRGSLPRQAQMPSRPQPLTPHPPGRPRR